ncbi:TetR/AcrR family transcriptional regulator [Poseidonibacter lekithochrous]|uniref:TetR/AcrR family transcriptional regulator n=1 Tax=Poseidonibacter TaxID=2321187 RepID=UPI001C0870D9|nr:MULTISPECIES: TetR/AcrR family transcriptional regulator [Poseidonibacter]MBU3013674.1 TetR/AcrR family transcriptional regulator [Poseidonibacter lekithochrous]MDO6826971.1 TetR/AcrR family transcriptional regulator [Poseidonibacter sp. 1_MG-2023]
MKKKISIEINKIKKELYVEESISYFDKKGFKNSKISEIAKELHTSVGTIYNLFNSKEELYLEYLIYKLKVFMGILNSKKTNIPLKNLENYLKYKYEIFIQIDENKNLPIINDPYFFHKLDISSNPVVEEIYIYLELQFKHIIKEPHISHRNLAILFKKFSDGFIESYITEEFETKNIIDITLDMFLNGVIKNENS